MLQPLLACRAEAQRAKAGGAEGDRTPDLVIANDALSQLSYGPKIRYEIYGGVPGDVKKSGMSLPQNAKRPGLGNELIRVRGAQPRWDARIRKTLFPAPDELNPTKIATKETREASRDEFRILFWILQQPTGQRHGNRVRQHSK
jgi:hypothetical protein